MCPPTIDRQFRQEVAILSSSCRALRFGTRSEQGTCAGASQAHFGMTLALCHRFGSASGRRSTSPQPRRIFPQRPSPIPAQEFKTLPEANQGQALRQTMSVASAQSSSALGMAWRYPAKRMEPAPTESTLDSIPGTPQHTPILPARALPNTLLQPGETNPLYLFACHIEWERREEASAAWELLSAAQSSNQNTRAHARA